MSAPVLDVRAHFDAVKAAIAAVNAQLGNDTYDFGEVPGLDGNDGTAPRIHALLQVERIYLPSTHGGRRATRSSWRASARYVGTTVDEATWALKHISTALDSRRLVVEGFTSTPLQHDVTDAIARDGGLRSGLTAWTYTL